MGSQIIDYSSKCEPTSLCFPTRAGERGREMKRRLPELYSLHTDEFVASEFVGVSSELRHRRRSTKTRLKYRSIIAERHNSNGNDIVMIL